MSEELKNPSKFSMWFNQNKPVIFTVAGVVSMVGGTVAACIATLKVDKIIRETNLKAEELKAKINATDDENDIKTLKKEGQKLIAHAIAKIAAYYAPSVALTGIGITGICLAQGDYKKKLAASASAYSAVSALLAKYEQAFIEKNGEEENDKLRLGVTEKKKTEIEAIDVDTGEIKKYKKEIPVTDPNLMGSPYAFYYDEDTSYDFVTTKGVSRDILIDMSYRILKAKEEHFNDILKARNSNPKCRQPLYISDVLEGLGMKHDGIPRYDKHGNIVSYDMDLPRVCGWVYDPDNPDTANRRIDLRIKTVYVKDEEGNYKQTIVLDPNVDGNVLGYEYVRRE